MFMYLYENKVNGLLQEGWNRENALRSLAIIG